MDPKLLCKALAVEFKHQLLKRKIPYDVAEELLGWYPGRVARILSAETKTTMEDVAVFGNAFSITPSTLLFNAEERVESGNLNKSKSSCYIEGTEYEEPAI